MRIIGLYDSFRIDAICPACKQKVNIELQTKALMRLLRSWNKGDIVETDIFIIKDIIITNCLGSCPSCKILLTADVVIKNQRFVKILNLKEWKRK